MNKPDSVFSMRRPSPSLRRTLARSFRDAWEHIGLVVAASTLTALLPTLLAVSTYFLADKPRWILAAVVFIIALLKGPILAGVFNLAHKIAYSDNPDLPDLLAGFRELFRASILLILLDLFVTICLAADAGFFLGIFGHLKPNAFSIALGCLFVYLFIAWFCSMGYQFPALTAQKPLNQKAGVLPAVYKSLLVSLSAPLYTLAVWLIAFVFILICVLSAFGVFLLLGGFIALVFTHALREIFVCYGVVDEPPDDGTL